MKGDETIRGVVILLAVLAFVAMAQGSSGDMDTLGKNVGIFNTGEATFRFPAFSDVNIDNLTIGNDRALAIALGVDPTATNNLEIKKNQDSGDCDSCCTGTADETSTIQDDCNSCCNSATEKASPEICAACQDACLKVNIDLIKVGNRDALAFGLSNSANNVKIVANQM
jgi:hypothetical protein